MRRRFMDGPAPTLPPEEYRLSATKRQSMETPLDERGFVAMDAVVDAAYNLVAPEYQWESPLNDIHHLQWSISTTTPDVFAESDRQVLREFRELVNQKMFTSRVFHNWIHWVMQPPPVPEVEAMQHSIEAQRVAQSLARTAKLATKLTRMPYISEKKLAERLDEEFITYNLYMDNARLVPYEFRVLRLEELEVTQPEDLLRVNKQLGRLAVLSIPVRLRTLRVAA